MKICEHLSNENCKLKELVFHKVTFSSGDCIQSLCESLQNNNSVETLLLYQVNIDSKLAKFVSKMISKNKKIKLLDLSKNAIEYEGFKRIQRSLFINNTLEKLHLWKTKLTNISINEVRNVLKYNSSLKEINFGNNFLFPLMMNAISCLEEKKAISPIESLIYPIELTVATLPKEETAKNFFTPKLRSLLQKTKQNNNKKTKTYIDLNENECLNEEKVSSQLISKKALDLSFANLINFPKKIEKNFASSLTAVYLDNNNLKEIPLSLFTILNMKTLYLNNNQISFIHPLISQLKNLTKLDISNNHLSNIAPELFENAKLSELYLYNNKIERIPNEISSLTNLKVLALHNNHLQSLPSSFYSLESLEEFYYNCNKISETRKKIINTWSSKEKIFSIRANKNLKNIPWEISFLSLTHIQLIDNAIVNVPPQIGYLSSLVSLELQNNKIEDLPWQLSLLSNLLKLELSGNPLSMIPVEVLNRDMSAILDFLKTHKQNDTETKSNIIFLGNNKLLKTNVVRSLKKSFQAFKNTEQDTSLQRGEESNFHQDLYLKFPDKKKAKLSLWNFEDEDSYFLTKTIFDSPKRIYVIAFDLNNQLFGEKLGNYAMSINNTHPKAPIILVASSAENLEEQKLNEYVKELQKNLAVFENVVSLLLFSSNLFKLRDKILQLIGHYNNEKQEEGVVQRCPSSIIATTSIELVQFRKLMRMEKETRKIPLIHIEEVQEMVKSSQLFEIELLDSSLKSLHDQSVIVYNSELQKIMSNYIVLNASWLNHLFTTMLENTNKEGQFNSSFETIWNQERYPPHLHPLFYHLLHEQEIFVDLNKLKPDPKKTKKNNFPPSLFSSLSFFKSYASLNIVSPVSNHLSLLVPSKVSGDAPDWLWHLLCQVIDSEGTLESKKIIFFDFLPVSFFNKLSTRIIRNTTVLKYWYLFFFFFFYNLIFNNKINDKTKNKNKIKIKYNHK